MKLQVLIAPGERNDATSKYIDLVVESLSTLFDEVCYCNSVKDINRKEWVVVVTLRTYFKLQLRKSARKVIFWFQGIEPEELTYCCGITTLRQYIRIKYFEIIERWVLSRAKMILFVSEAMLVHYSAKYGYRKDNYCIIPCQNAQLQKDAFIVNGKYNNMKFVYAGGMIKWQCIEQTLAMFREISTVFPNASLTLLTGDREEAKHLVEKTKTPNVTIGYVPLAKLNDELAKYKYGFLLREDIELNNVATPTKFNSYLSLGIIPIVTRAVHDFRPYIDKSQYVVVVDKMGKYDKAIERIREIESEDISCDGIYEDFKSVFFTKYYNPEFHIQVFRQKFKQHND